MTILTLGTGQNRQENDLVDPYGGQRDLQARVLRHVTDAFREDPVRILRVARFAARFSDFRVAPETLQLMREMVQHGEADHLVAERVWQELARGLMEATPSRLFDVLIECGALKVLLPEVDRLWGVPQRPDYHPEIDTGVHLLMVLDMSARLHAPLTVRLACLMHDLGKGTTPADMLPRHIGHEERSVKPCASACASRWTARNSPKSWRASTATSTAAATFQRGSHWCVCWSAATPSASRRDSARFCWPANATREGASASRNSPYPQRERLAGTLAAAQSVATADIAQQAMGLGLAGPKVGERIHAARIAAVAAWLGTTQPRAPVEAASVASRAD
jgi:tRNA nucleotidyltransferase (CCA-adding enzyme)